LAGGTSPEPIPAQSPPPDYPRRALRRGIEGTVLVRAEVGPDGVPVSVSIVQGSRSRDLDRAAVDAVRRWRFRPGQVDGRPVVGSVVIPIEFRARR
jgi:protein TonB